MQGAEDEEEKYQEVDQWMYIYDQDIIVKLQGHLPLTQSSSGLL